VNATLTNPTNHDELLHDDVEPPFEDSYGHDGDDGGDGDGEPIRWVTVASFWSIEQAHLARLKVEADDIPCMLENEHLVSMNWLWANAVGGVRLRVPSEDATRARELLRLPPLIELRDDASADGPLVRCPRCGSTDVRHERFARWAVFGAVLLLGFPLPLLRRRRRCGACGSAWRRDVVGFPVVRPDA
jgi:hypothetical protein